MSEQRFERVPSETYPCAGCGATITRRHVACWPCWRRVPGVLKGQLQEQRPGTIGAARVVGQMRVWLKDNSPVTP